MARHSVLAAFAVAAFLITGCAPNEGASVAPAVLPAEHVPTRELPGSKGPVTEATEIGVLLLEPPSFTTEGIRMATFNVEFLFDGEEPEGQADFLWKGDPEAARHHRDGVAQIIRLLDADLVLLQEVEHGEVVQAMIDESLADMGYEVHFVQGRDTFTRQNVALIARIPIAEIGRTDERAPVADTGQDYGVSKNMWARLDLAGVPVTLIGIHFLSRASDPERAPRREAQAEVIRRLADREFEAGREVVVIGDFNDFDDQVLDRRAAVPVSRVMSIIKQAGPGLDNVIGSVPQHLRFTNHWDRNRNGEIEEGELSAIDHILLSPLLTERLLEVRYVHAHDPRSGPDHFPIVVTINP